MCVESRKEKQLISTEERLVVPRGRGWGVGAMGEAG